MLYHAIHRETHELITLTAADILDMDYDTAGRVVITAVDQQCYFLLASKDIVHE
ncbi:hypothetical protein [Paenibacillus sp. UNC451MF]|uniref:hypothetical protein n=1 Tax=Paenibacillus sp. UNC451MF TaxID=1449063 RepID=UPI000A3F751F|nr:hypothetical protein [Paenibacillus sp. UNC451MF]